MIHANLDRLRRDGFGALAVNVIEQIVRGQLPPAGFVYL
jgi:hypothetical protein